MQSTATITENLTSIETLGPKSQALKKPINTNYLILAAIALFCCVLLFLGFPFWAVLVFGLGMSTILFLLYLIRGINIDFELDGKELDEAIKHDLFY